MRDSSLLIAIIGAVLVSVCSSNPQSFRGSAEDEPVRMASESLVVKSYKGSESSTTSTTKSHGERFEEYQIYQGVMGRPGIDFPVYPQIPATSFSCRGVKKSGYYADLETDCQVFHICDGNRKISFLCPNGTIFRQSHLICDWWFRVDCGKSVELYEESAEQLAADQKIYKARSEERERRRKQGKAAADKGGELTSAEVYALDEPFHLKSRKSDQNRNQFTPNGTRAPTGRNSFEGRKSERHSKKVVDSGATERFQNYNRDKQNGRVTEKTKTTKPVDNRQHQTIAAITPEPKVSFVENPVTPSTYKARYQTANSINFGGNKENIQPAESGSLVEDLNHRNANFGYNSTRQTYDFNGREKSTPPDVKNRKINQTVDFTNFANTQTQTAEVHNRGNKGFAYNENQNAEDNSDRNINFNYNEKRGGEQAGRSNNYSYKDRKTQQYTFETTKTNYKKGEEPTEADVTAYTTEFFNYESKRTNPVERQEAVTPIFQTTRRIQSSRYRSSTPTYEDQEKQFFAETASFASNRGGKSYSDFQNQFNTFDKGGASTTINPYKTTLYTTTPQPPVQKYSTANFNSDHNLYKTSTFYPVKQHSRKVTINPSTSPQTTYASRIWQTTTFQPLLETTTNEKFTVDDIYFTTSTPDKEIEFITETNSFGLSQKQTESATESQTRYDFIQSTLKPDIDISLQELNINKTPQPTTIGKSYEDFVREGLEVPPSSGPNAIRSFALYFATTGNNPEEDKTTAYLTTNEPEITTILTPLEIKKKEVVKQVDELVQRSSLNTSEHVGHSEELPNSLTPNTQNSYSALFPSQITENQTSTSVAERVNDYSTESFETTAFESFTEEPNKINKELTKNDLDGSQSRGLVEPDPHSDTDYGKASPDLRELAQVFTKALSAYLDDPEAFRKVLSEIRPTEPTFDSEVSSSNPLDYPSATQEDDEVLDFSDVTKSSYRRKTSTVSGVRETTTEYFTEAPTTRANDVENLVLPLNRSSWATNIELTAPLLETLDQSQSNYYTPPPYVGTTNSIAEEINNEFTISDMLSQTEQNEAVDSYLPIKGSVDDPSLPRYGGFQNNTNPTTKYSPYGAELTATTYLPYGAELTSTSSPNTAATSTDITTFNPNNATSFFSHFSKNESEEGEIQLAKELNNLVLLQKFTTPRGAQRETTAQEPNLSTVHLASQNNLVQYQDVKLGNGETIETSVRGGKSLHFPEVTINSNSFEPDAKEINLELSPPPSTPKGFLITYSIGATSTSEVATYLPKATTPVVKPTTYSPARQTTYTFAPETQPPTFNPAFENFSERLERLTKSRTTTEFYTTTPPQTTISFGKSTKSIERLTQLQETLMFNTNNVTIQQRDEARVSVEEIMDKMNMTDSTANTLMKVMEMAAKNETYRRLVLLLVNDKSGKNKTVEESRLSLLKALLTPVINPPRTVVPISETSKLEPRRRSTSRRSKSIKADNAINVVSTVTLTTTTQRPTSGRKGKPSRGLTRAESNYKSGLGNLEVIKRTIETSKNKQVKINSIDDAILDSDSRAVELLRSLYSLAARWG